MAAVERAETYRHQRKVKTALRSLVSSLLPNGSADAAERKLFTLVKQGQYELAFPLLNEFKARRRAVRNIDYLRALCFLGRNQEEAATEALKEELRYFPDNLEAAELMVTLQRKRPLIIHTQSDPEFVELMRIVRPYTMLSEARLFSLFTLAKAACAEDLPGNIVECGVAAGGSSALLAAVFARHSARSRRLFAFDTFEGMPVPGEKDQHGELTPAEMGWGAGTCAAPEASLGEVCEKLGVSGMVEPVPGLFGTTLPVHRERVGPIALLHMDGDWYESTRDILVHFFDQVVTAGRIQIDDYGYWQGCRAAVEEFAAQRQVPLNLHRIDETGVWLQK